MIISRAIAKRRIAAGTYPSWGGAWGLVLLDFVLFGVYAVVAYSILMMWILVIQPAHFLIYLAAFLVLFVPMQIVLIVSSLWASKSRWTDTEPTQ